MSTSGGTGGGDIATVAKTITNTQINTLFSAPVELVATPGANRMIEVVNWTLEAVPGAVGNWYMAGALYLVAGTTVTGPFELGPSVATPQMLNGDPLPNVAQFFPVNPLVASVFPTANLANKSLTCAIGSANPERIGGLTAVTINNGGAGYASGDTGTVDPVWYGGSAAYVIDAVGAAGIATALHLTAAGTGYGQGETNNGTTAGGAQPGVGTGLTLDLTTVVQPQGTLYLTVAYRIVTTH